MAFQIPLVYTGYFLITFRKFVTFHHYEKYNLSVNHWFALRNLL